MHNELIYQVKSHAISEKLSKKKKFIFSPIFFFFFMLKIKYKERQILNSMWKRNNI
jgi:hypothetical protein